MFPKCLAKQLLQHDHLVVGHWLGRQRLRRELRCLKMNSPEELGVKRIIWEFIFRETSKFDPLFGWKLVQVQRFFPLLNIHHPGTTHIYLDSSWMLLGHPWVLHTC